MTNGTIVIKNQHNKGTAADGKKEQIRIDGQAVAKDSEKDGVMGVKAKVKDQILKHVAKQGKLLLHWRRQPTTGESFPYVFPLWLSIALQCTIEQVCEGIVEAIESRDVQSIGNIPRPITAAVLVEHCHRWDEVSKNPAQAGKIQCKMSLLPPFAVSGKAAPSQTAMESMLL